MSEPDTKRVEIKAVKVNGEPRVGFSGMDTLEIDDAITREESDEAWQRYAIEDLPDGTVIGEIVLQNGEYERTVWHDPK